MLDADRKPQRRDQQTCDATPGELRPVEFRLGGLEPGTHQGFVRIDGQDGLAADDTRYFTVVVKPAWRVLMAAPKPAQSYALFLTEALAPDLFRKRGQARFDCDICDLGELAKRPLADYAAVCLLDPTPLEPATWKKLADFAAEGRGVAIFLGRNAMPIESFNGPQAQELLPGKLLRQARRPDGDLHLAPRDYQHPILAAFRGQAGAIPWEAFPVFRYWELDPIPVDSRPRRRRSAQPWAAVPHGSERRPALQRRKARHLGARDRPRPRADDDHARLRSAQPANPWNLLPAGEAWPFLILANQMAAYLVGSSNQQLNYLAGQTAVLPVDPSAQRGSYLLFTPGGLSFPISADLKRHELAITATDQVGNYRVQAGGSGGVDLGFSVNYAPDQTRLDRLNDEELTGVFGPVKFRLARTRQQIDRDISVGRVGRELFPPLIVLLALVLGLEMFVANRFYRE